MFELIEKNRRTRISDAYSFFVNHFLYDDKGVNYIFQMDKKRLYASFAIYIYSFSVCLFGKMEKKLFFF